MSRETELNAPTSMAPWLRGGVEAGRAEPVGDDLTVGEVSALVGISVRTLHHWDSVGLVTPLSRTAAGYRTYSSSDVARIHRVLVYQELGFSLTTIAELLDDPEVDETAQLRAQRALLDERIERLGHMAIALDQVLAARESGAVLTARQQAEIFGRGWRQDWADEAESRWGDSTEWAQFERNALALSDAERLRVQESGRLIYAALAEAKRSGLVPDSEDARRLVEQHRAMIGQLFDCTHSMQVCLGRMYVQDVRFTAYFDDLESGLAEWLSSAIDANAWQLGVDPESAVWE